MKQYLSISKYSAYITSLVVMLVSPIITFAQDGPGKYIDKVGGLPQGSLVDLIATVIQAALTLVGAIALAFFIYGGFIYITSGGEEKQVEQGKKTMIYALIGILAIGFSYALVQFVIGAFDGGGSGGVG